MSLTIRHAGQVWEDMLGALAPPWTSFVVFTSVQSLEKDST